MLSIFTGCRHRDAAGGTVVPREITAVLDNSMQFVLLSVDPLPVALRRQSDLPKEVFHDHAVLGQTEIRDKAERALLLRALYKGIGESGFGKSDTLTGRTCFNPRHGIHATNGNGTVDLLICFECFWIRTYTRDREETITTTDSPQKSFDAALKAAHVPLPMP